jgi:copper chaperone CopZ
MKNLFLFVFFCLSLGLQAQTGNSKKEKAQFEVVGNCEMCKKRIEKAALDVKGVKMANWDIPSNQLMLIYNAQKLDILEVHNAIAQAGHDTKKATANDEVYANLPLCCLYERKQ